MKYFKSFAITNYSNESKREKERYFPSDMMWPYIHFFFQVMDVSQCTCQAKSPIVLAAYGNERMVEEMLQGKEARGPGFTPLSLRGKKRFS